MPPLDFFEQSDRRGCYPLTLTRPDVTPAAVHLVGAFGERRRRRDVLERVVVVGGDDSLTERRLGPDRQTVLDEDLARQNVEYAYAKQNKLTYTGLVNKAGKPVQPTVEAFQAAASNADWAKAPGYYVILTDQPGDKSWPITAATFILMHKDATDKAASQEAIKFFRWAFKSGGKAAEELDYIPMPDPVVQLIEKTWAAEIKS